MYVQNEIRLHSYSVSNNSTIQIFVVTTHKSCIDRLKVEEEREGKNKKEKRSERLICMFSQLLIKLILSCIPLTEIIW